MIQQWVISEEVAHGPLVSEEDFVAAQRINAIPKVTDNRRPCFRLTGLIRCGVWGRVLDGHWMYYRAVYIRVMELGFTQAIWRVALPHQREGNIQLQRTRTALPFGTKPEAWYIGVAVAGFAPGA